MLSDTLPDSSIEPQKIALVGIGGMGTHVLDVADELCAGDYLLASVNLNIHLLESSLAPIKLQLGAQLTHGLGAGGDSATGAKAAREGIDSLTRLLKACRIAVLISGLGGGTGSGVTPVVAKLAKELGVFVVSVVTTPFSFEGQRRQEQAQKALSELSAFSDILLHFDNESMAGLVADDGSILHAFENSNRLLKKVAYAIPTLATGQGLIQVGLDDLKKVLPSGRSRRCLFGYAQVGGDKRAEEAVPQLLRSPFFAGSSGLRDISDLLLYVVGDASLGLDELRVLMESARHLLPQTARLHLGVSTDSKLHGELSVCCFASTLASVQKREIAPIPEPEPVVELNDDETLCEEDDLEEIPQTNVASDPVIIFSDSDPTTETEEEDEGIVDDSDEEEEYSDSEDIPDEDEDSDDEKYSDRGEEEEQLETIDMDIMELAEKNRRDLLSSDDNPVDDPFLPPRLRSR